MTRIFTHIFCSSVFNVKKDIRDRITNIEKLNQWNWSSRTSVKCDKSTKDGRKRGKFLDHPRPKWYSPTHSVARSHRVQRIRMFALVIRKNTSLKRRDRNVSEFLKRIYDTREIRPLFDGNGRDTAFSTSDYYRSFANRTEATTGFKLVVTLNTRISKIDIPHPETRFNLFIDV